MFYQNAYPVTAAVYGLHPLRDPDLANFAPMRDSNLIFRNLGCSQDVFDGRKPLPVATGAIIDIREVGIERSMLAPAC